MADGSASAGLLAPDLDRERDTHRWRLLAREFAEDVVRPVGEALDRMDARDVARPGSPLFELLAQAHREGFTRLWASRQAGGLGLMRREEAAVLEELATADAGLTALLAVAPTPFRWAGTIGRPALDARLGRPYAAGGRPGWIGCWAPAGPAGPPRAVRTGGGWRLSGVTAPAPAGAIATHALVACTVAEGDEGEKCRDVVVGAVRRSRAVSDVAEGHERAGGGDVVAGAVRQSRAVSDVAERHERAGGGDVVAGAVRRSRAVVAVAGGDVSTEGAALAVVALGCPGVARRPAPDGPGLRALCAAALAFDGVEIAADALAPVAALPVTAWPDAGPAGALVALGIGRAAYEGALRWAREGVWAGRPAALDGRAGPPLWEMLVLLDAAGGLARGAAGPGERAPATRAAHAFAAEAAFQVAEAALRLCGGAAPVAFLDGTAFDPDKLLRDARTAHPTTREAPGHGPGQDC